MRFKVALIFKKILCCFSIILLATNVYAMTKTEFLHEHEAAIVELCEDFEAERVASRDNPLARFMMIPGRYECGLTSLYGLHKVMMFMEIVDRDSNDWEVLMELMKTNLIKEYETYDFIAIHLEFETYLEEKKDKDKMDSINM